MTRPEERETEAPGETEGEPPADRPLSGLGLLGALAVLVVVNGAVAWSWYRAHFFLVAAILGLVLLLGEHYQVVADLTQWDRVLADLRLQWLFVLTPLHVLWWAYRSWPDVRTSEELVIWGTLVVFLPIWTIWRPGLVLWHARRRPPRRGAGDRS